MGPDVRRVFYRVAEGDWAGRNVYPAGLSLCPVFLQGGRGYVYQGVRGADVRG